MPSPTHAFVRSATESPAAPGTTSLWMRSDAATPSLAPLENDLRTDVCIVGAGIAGLSVAYQLARAGKAVVVVDDGPVGGGETARTSAHIASILDARYADLERMHGERIKQIAESHARAIDEIEATCRRENIVCDFERVDGYLYLAPKDDPATLTREHAAALRAGVAAAWVDRAPLPFATRRCLRFPGQAQFHPLRYLAGLADAVVRAGGMLVAGHATRMTTDSVALVELDDGHTIAAHALVVATNSPVNDRITMHTKQAPYRTYVITASLPAGTVPHALYWDTDDPYHYVRLQHGDEHDVLIVGGEDHHTGQGGEDPTRFERLEEWARERFSTLGGVLDRWSGQVVNSVDGLGFIGRNPGDDANVYIATGDTGNGLTNGTIAGMLISDLVLGRKNAWQSLYDPARITPLAAWSFTRESLHVAAGYARWLAPGDAKTVGLAPGHGTVVQRGLRKVAVYRDPQGALHECSAVCPHLGGVVAWNDVEKSWDCPCHGSRFDSNGRVLNGPANRDLEPA
jgi:glycine/D-amino acid oxidase-like deaminating enzyme/nitrite reductase/ring-hydroxylating ferredoxin subunit